MFGKHPKNPPGCKLLGPFALIVQASMGVLAVLTLVVKRQYEVPRRPWWVWFFDVSKQLCGAAGLHFLNLFLSILTSSRTDVPDTSDNPCDYYFLNVLMDTTVGVPVLWGFLVLVTNIAEKQFKVTEIESGVYGHPPQWRAFWKQAGVYVLAMILMKIVLATSFIIFPWLDYIGAFLLKWTDNNPDLQVAFVMLIFPLFMNALQYYLIDNIIESNSFRQDYHNVPNIGEENAPERIPQQLAQSSYHTFK